jgi:hypothetical protein
MRPYPATIHVAACPDSTTNVDRDRVNCPANPGFDFLQSFPNENSDRFDVIADRCQVRPAAISCGANHPTDIDLDTCGSFE